MGSRYEIMFTGGDTCQGNRRLFIQTYANSTNANKKIKDSTSEVNQGLKKACEDLLQHNEINYYEIVRFKAEDHNFSNIDFDGQDAFEIESDVNNYLKNENGTGDDLLTLRGGHVVFHEDDCVVDNAAYGTGDGGDCDTSGGSKTSAFSQGRIAWSPLTCAEKTGASAVQEPFHNFIMHNHPNVEDQLEDIYGSSHNRFEEHALGSVKKLNGTNRVTPLLTYHDHQFDSANTCSSDADTSVKHTPIPTDCTRQAMYYMAIDSDCNDQSSNICNQS